MNGFTAREETGHPSTATEVPQATLSELERRHIERVLEEVRWNQRRAARILGISRWSLARRLRKYAVRRPTGEQHA